MNFLRMAEVPLKDKRVFIRCDLNVPRDEHGKITEDTRIRASMPAIRMALDGGASAVMVTSHLGRPTEGALTAEDSLKTVGLRLQELLGVPVSLIKNWVDGGFVTEPGTVFLLENCRGNVGEKKNDEELARRMAGLCDVWVHDAFGTAHRAEATTYGMGQYAKMACAGPLLAAEFDALGKALSNPARPLVAIVGGSKISSKLNILSNLADRVDQLVVGGGMANTFLLSRDMPVGKSLVEKDLVKEARAISDKMAKRGTAVWLPTDVVCAKEMTFDAKVEVKKVGEVMPDDIILDVGPASAENLAQLLLKAGTIVWNGPVGVFEMEPFSSGTQALARAVMASNAFSIAGGGDTLAAIHKYNVGKDISYISTGGGAFLEFLEGKTMPAMEVLGRRA